MLLIAGSYLNIVVAFTPPADYLEAVELCDKTDLRPIEGIWSYPEDDVTVMVYRSGEKGRYDIYVVEAADCSLSPAMKIGELHESPEPEKFSLKLFTRSRKGVLSIPCSATARFSENKGALIVTKPSLKLKFNPTRLLPYFWRIVSVSVKPGESVPEGMIKVYPSFDGNNSSRREPRYL